MIRLEHHPKGVILPVRAHSGARKNGIAGEHNGMLKVSVTQAPVQGKANKAIVELLCKSLGLKRSQIELLSGETTGQKRFLLRGIAVDDIRRHFASVI